MAEYTEMIRRSEPADARYMNNHRGHLVYCVSRRTEIHHRRPRRYTSFTCTRDEVLGWMHAIRAAGYREFILRVIPGQEHVLEDWARIMLRMGDKDGGLKPTPTGAGRI